MDAVDYVNSVGKLINKELKCNSKMNRVSIINFILFDHLTKLYKKLETDIANNLINFPFTIDDLNKLGLQIECVRKGIDYYPSKVIDNDCILTETDQNIIQE